MEQINLSCQARKELGKNAAGRIRTAGQVPAVLYGAGIESALALSLNTKELDKVLHTAAGGNVLVNLNIDGQQKMAMFKEVTYHPLKGSIEHVDLFAIQMDHKVHVDVPVHLVGKAAGLAFGGIVQQEARKIKVECLPTHIPDSFDVDITNLGINQSVHVKDIKLPEGIKAIDPDMTIVSMVAPTAEVAPKTAEEVQAELAKSFEEKEEAGKKEE